METALTGAAGVYFVAARLAAMGYKCAPTFGNVPSVDIVVSNSAGSASVALQVKTAVYGLRTRGRGKDKKPHHYEWDIGPKSSRLSAPNLYFALVDLKGFSELPDVYVVPSVVIAEYFNGGVYKRARYHPPIQTLDQYRNSWNRLRNRLSELEEQAGRANGGAILKHGRIADDAREAKLLEETRRGRESLKHIYVTEEDIRAAKQWGRE